MLGIGLTNLNAERSNNPGLDLGDSTSGWAFQLTAQKTSEKVRETLEAITEPQEATYKNIRILVIGEKQRTYTLDGEHFERFNFKQEMIWDFNDVCGRIMSLSMDNLVDLAKYISSETRRVRVELEIPDEEGRFPSMI